MAASFGLAGLVVWHIAMSISVANKRSGVAAGWRVLFAFQRPWSREGVVHENVESAPSWGEPGVEAGGRRFFAGVLSSPLVSFS